jgi:ribonuclease D
MKVRVFTLRWDEAGARFDDAELRSWRGRTAKREGMPPYLICNNRQLAALAARRPDCVAALREIEGLGEAKAERWGEEILKLIAAAPDASAVSSGATTEHADRPGQPDQRGTGAPIPPRATDG